MINYEPFWNTIRKKNVSTYKLINNGVGKQTIQKLRHNQNVNLLTLDNICRLLDCDIADVVTLAEKENNKNQESK